jgi:hypothetical protein
MRYRSLLALVLCLGLQTSLCTGGALSFVSGVSDYFAYQADEAGLMSYGAIGYLSCENNESDSGVGSVNTGCGDASDCLLQAFNYAQDQTVFLLSSVDLSELSFLFTPLVEDRITITPRQIARSGPLYEDASNLSHTLLKRE